MADRDGVVIWIDRINGGKGHFGVDLITPYGNPCMTDRIRPYCCAPTYFWCPTYGSPNSPRLPDYITVRNDVNGHRTNIANDLIRYDIELYSYDASGRESIYPTHLAVRFDGTSFSPIDPSTPHLHYSTHWGNVNLRRIDYRPGRENFALYNGYITYGGERVFNYELGVILWGTGAPHDYTNFGSPLYGYKCGGNRDAHGQLTDPSYWTSGPVLPGKYNVMFILRAPNGREKTQSVNGLDILRHYEYREIRVEDFFSTYELEVPTGTDAPRMPMRERLLPKLRLMKEAGNIPMQQTLVERKFDEAGLVSEQS